MATEPVVDDTNIYEQLDNYPWDSDKEFQGGLSAILGPNPSPSQLQDLTLRAQCFYLSRKKSVPIDFNGYKAYLASKQPKSTGATPSSKETTASSTAASESPSNTHSTPTTQATSPQTQPTPSNIDTMAVASTPTDPSSFTAPAAGAQPGAPYPRSFAEIVALIQSGAPIPGIREIDDTPMGLAASSPSVLPKRRKPWEKDVPEEVIQGRGPGTFGDHRDQQIRQEYPDA